MALFQGSLANLIGIKRCFSNGIKAKRGTDSCWGWIWPWLSAEHPCRVQGGYYTPGDSSKPYQFPSPCSEPILGTLPKPRLERQSPRFSSISGLSGASSTIWQNNLHGTGKRDASRAPASASDPHPARQRPHLRPSLCCPASVILNFCQAEIWESWDLSCFSCTLRAHVSGCSSASWWALRSAAALQPAPASDQRAETGNAGWQRDGEKCR